MGFLDGLLGTKGKLKGAAPDRLFAMTTANVTLETGLSLKSKQCAGVVFQPIATADFRQIVAETEELLKGTAEETGTKVETHDDEFSYRWMVLRDDELEDLAVGINAVSDALAINGYKDRVLCAVFAFKDSAGKPLYFIYNYKRGSWYPFVPDTDPTHPKQRSTERELQVKAIIGKELPIEPDLERWFPLWGIPI